MNAERRSQRAGWNDLERFPPASQPREMMRLPWGRAKHGEGLVRKAVDRWNLFDPLLVATPESARLLPPICVSSLTERIHRSLLARQKAFAILLGLLITAFAASRLFLPFNAPRLHALFLLLLAFAYVVADTTLVYRNRNHLIERALFIDWIFSRRNALLIAFVVTMACAGIVQVVAEYQLGGFELVVIGYGMYFQSIESGEWWRYLVGPFIHEGWLHWIDNLIMGVIITGIAGTVGRRSLIFYFILLAVSSSLAVQMFGGAARPDALVCVSGAVFGLFGWSIAYFYRRRARYPKHLALSLLLFTVFNLALTFVVIGRFSQVSHVAGLGLGLVLGALGAGWKKDAPPLVRADLPIETVDHPDSPTTAARGRDPLA